MKLLTPCTKLDSSLPTAFRETAEGGLAATPTGRRLQKRDIWRIACKPYF